MSLTVSIENRERPFSTVARVIALLCVCSAGAITEPYEFEPGQDIAEAIGRENRSY